MRLRPSLKYRRFSGLQTGKASDPIKPFLSYFPGPNCQAHRWISGSYVPTTGLSYLDKNLHVSYSVITLRTMTRPRVLLYLSLNEEKRKVPSNTNQLKYLTAKSVAMLCKHECQSPHPKQGQIMLSKPLFFLGLVDTSVSSMGPSLPWWRGEVPLPFGGGSSPLPGCETPPSPDGANGAPATDGAFPPATRAPSPSSASLPPGGRVPTPAPKADPSPCCGMPSPSSCGGLPPDRPCEPPPAFPILDDLDHGCGSLARWPSIGGSWLLGGAGGISVASLSRSTEATVCGVSKFPMLAPKLNGRGDDVESFDLFRFAILGLWFTCSAGNCIIEAGWALLATTGWEMSWGIFPEGSMSPCSSGDRGNPDACVGFDKVTGPGPGSVSPSLFSTGRSICASGTDKGRDRGDAVRILESVHVVGRVPRTALESVELLFECTPMAFSVCSVLGRNGWRL